MRTGFADTTNPDTWQEWNQAVQNGNLSKDEYYNRLTLVIMEKYLDPFANCVDVGCHVGSVLQDMLRLAPQGTHHAFEPIPNLYRRLCADFARFPGVVFHNLALSDVTGESTFQLVTEFPGYSGLKRRKYPRPQTHVEEILVGTARLDDVLPQEFPVRFIKIDVEGAELQVLRGAGETIQRNRPLIVFEHGLGAANFYGTEPGHVHDFLTGNCRLHVSLLSGWLAGGPPLDRQQFSDQFQQGLNYYFLAHP